MYCVSRNEFPLGIYECKQITCDAARGAAVPRFTQVARQSFAKAPRLKVAAMEVRKTRHLDRYYAHVRHEREDFNLGAA